MFNRPTPSPGHPTTDHPTTDHPISERPTLAPAEEIDDHDRGLAYDLGTLWQRTSARVRDLSQGRSMDRRTLLGAAGGALLLAGCGASGATPAATSATTAATTASTSARGGTTGGAPGAAGGTGNSGAIPQETAGPFPGDGTNGPNVLTQSGIVRSDITKSFGSASGLAKGVPLTLVLRLTNLSASGAPFAGAAVYVWHCDREGNYSLYSKAAVNENYLRGVQVAGADGSVTFTSIFPGAYSGRWPHIHFEVYRDVAAATKGSAAIATSQVALPAEAANAAYATAGYEASIPNMKRTTLANDNVFGNDGGVRQLAAMSGNATSGFTAVLPVPV